MQDYHKYPSDIIDIYQTSYLFSVDLPKMAESKKADYGLLEFPSNVEVNDDVPSPEKIAKIADYPVLNTDGKEVPFRSLYEGVNGKKNHNEAQPHGSVRTGHFSYK